MKSRHRHNLAAAGIALIVVSVAVVVLSAGYLFGWWLRADSKNREVRISNTNKGVQTAWRDEALDHISEIDVLANSPNSSAAVAALKNRACDLIGRLTLTYRNDERIVDFWETECI